MDLLTLSGLDLLDWQPRHYKVGPDGTRYGYDKAVDPRYSLPGIAVDFVRLRSGLVIPEHYHRKAVENFAVLEGEALFQTRSREGEERTEREVFPGDVIRISPGELHRVVNRSDSPFYLWRHAIKEPDDSVFTEYPELFTE